MVLVDTVTTVSIHITGINMHRKMNSSSFNTTDMVKCIGSNQITVSNCSYYYPISDHGHMYLCNQQGEQHAEKLYQIEPRRE